MLTMVSDALGKTGEASEVYLVHRLDTVVGGLLAFARNKSAAKELSALVSDGTLKKEYLAVVEGDAYGGTLIDYLAKDSRINKAIVKNSSQNGAKYAELSYTVLEKVNTENGTLSLVRISLKTGRFHQIRAQFSSRNMPLLCDSKYGSKNHRARHLALFAYKLDFRLSGEKITVIKYPELDIYPWNLFSEESYKDD